MGNILKLQAYCERLQGVTTKSDGMWGNQHLAPRTKPGPSAHARVDRIAKGFANRPAVRAQPIGTEPQRTVRGTAADPLDQPSDQGHVALGADLAAQPQARLDQHPQRHPHDAALFLDAQFIGLHLS